MRIKPLTLFGIAVAGAVGLLAGSQVWVSFMLEGSHSPERVTGHELNAALTPVCIAVIAAALALTIAGPVFRRVLGVLVLGLGAGAVALSLVVLVNPTESLAGRVTELTGIAGDAGLSSIIWSDVSAWGYVSVASGVVTAVLGVVVLFTSGRWAAAGRKYEDGPREAVSGAPDRISDWDALSDGDDPTTQSR